MRRGPKREAPRAIFQPVDDASSRAPLFMESKVLLASRGVLSTFGEPFLTNSGRAEGPENAGSLRRTACPRKRERPCLSAQGCTPAALSSRLLPPRWGWTSEAPEHGPTPARPSLRRRFSASPIPRRFARRRRPPPTRASSRP
jgi:hypothetical protein